MSSQKRILICPLDWGLGHATRCIPIIRYLLEKNAEVIIAGDGAAIDLLKQEFPHLKYVYLKGYGIKYSTKIHMVAKMLFSLPEILFRIVAEHQQLKKIIKINTIDIVISDNRYGLWNRNVKSIFITHQLMIKTPFAERTLHQLILFFVNKYDECWIPDEAGENNLSGDLSHQYPLPNNSRFIGVLSRFEKQGHILSYNYTVAVIISGPEPQRSEFEKLVLLQLKEKAIKAIVVCGKPGIKETIKIDENITLVSHMNSKELQKTIEASEIIIARSGYSTIMDLAILGKKAIFIPTPGQTEQEYLAERLMKKKTALFQTQTQFNLEKALEGSKEFSGLKTLKTPFFSSVWNFI